MHDNKLRVTQTFGFPPQKCYGPQNVCRLENSMSFDFCGSISIFGDVCAEFVCVGGVVRQKNVFSKYLNLNIKLEFLSICPGRFMNYQFFELSSSFVAHSDEK